MKTTFVPCPKCDGTKTIQAFGYIANGVCFRCAGNGTVKAGTVKERPATEYQIKCAEWILSVTDETLAKLDYTQLLKARDFVHYPVPGYPTIREVWFAKGERFFQAAQDERLARYVA